uniref:Uncharacterized protein n=1 Tax=Marseillevirus LCMAC103 TaxID=2506604 RepID=A0A481YTU8_9VIRU|nr:MAG: hypothetical protein LCMAC103_00740 [Marseillevirus LCMAC103]
MDAPLPAAGNDPALAYLITFRPADDTLLCTLRFAQQGTLFAVNWFRRVVDLLGTDWGTLFAGIGLLAAGERCAIDLSGACCLYDRGVFSVEGGRRGRTEHTLFGNCVAVYRCTVTPPGRRALARSLKSFVAEERQHVGMFRLGCELRAPPLFPRLRRRAPKKL